MIFYTFTLHVAILQQGFASTTMSGYHVNVQLALIVLFGCKLRHGSHCPSSVSAALTIRGKIYEADQVRYVTSIIIAAKNQEGSIKVDITLQLHSFSVGIDT